PLGFVGHELGQDPSKADRLRAELLAHQPVARTRRITLIEDEVDDGEHRPKTAREVRLIWDPIRNARVANLALGADQPLCHGRLGYQEGPRDLGGRETAEKPQRER